MSKPELAVGQVWVDGEKAERSITLLTLKKVKYKYRHPQSSLVKEMEITREKFIDQMNKHGYSLKEDEPESPEWQDWEDKIKPLSWEDWD